MLPFLCLCLVVCILAWSQRMNAINLFVSVIFFFSSRRRHTRCLSDWSSDVCSSDLGRPRRRERRGLAGARSTRKHPRGGAGPHRRRRRQAHARGRGEAREASLRHVGRDRRQRRSEERRVGKERETRERKYSEKTNEE